MNANKKSGKAKFQTLVNAFPGRKIGVERIKKYTGLSEKSIYMYTSWKRYGSFRNGKLCVA